MSLKETTVLALFLLTQLGFAGEKNGGRGNFVTLENTLGFVESPESFVPGPTNAELVLSADDYLIWETRGKPKSFVRPPVPYRYYLQRQINEPATLIFEGVYLQGAEPTLLGVSTNGSVLIQIDRRGHSVGDYFQVGVAHHFLARLNQQDKESLEAQTNNVPISFSLVTTNRTFTDDSIPGKVIGVSSNGSLLLLAHDTTTNTRSLPDIPSTHYYRVYLKARDTQGIQGVTNSICVLFHSDTIQDWELTYAFTGRGQITIKTPKEPNKSVMVLVPKRAIQNSVEAIHETVGAYNCGVLIRRQLPVLRVDREGLTIWNGEQFTNALWTVEKPTKP